MISKLNIFKLALIAAIIAISYLVFFRLSYPQVIPNMDNVGHLVSFFCLSYLIYFAFKPKWYLLAITLACYTIFIQLVKLFLPYHSASLANFVADMVGVLLFYFYHWIYQRYIQASHIYEPE